MLHLVFGVRKYCFINQWIWFIRIIVNVWKYTCMYIAYFTLRDTPFNGWRWWKNVDGNAGNTVPSRKYNTGVQISGQRSLLYKASSQKCKVNLWDLYNSWKQNSLVNLINTAHICDDRVVIVILTKLIVWIYIEFLQQK